MEARRRTSTIGSLLIVIGACLVVAVVLTYLYSRFEGWAQAQPRSVASSQLVWPKVPPMTPLPSSTPVPSPTPTPTPIPGPPVKIQIPALRIDRTIVTVGIITRNSQVEWDAAKLFATSSRRDLVGQLEGSANPGQAGNIILIGHNYNRGIYNWTGVFFSLNRLKEGDLVRLYNESDELYEYQVVSVEKVPLSERDGTNIMTHIAYLSPTQDETLTLVTCGGANFAPFPSRIYVVAKRLVSQK